MNGRAMTININELTDHQKSVLIAYLCEWKIEYDDSGTGFYVSLKEGGVTHFSIYLTSPNYLYNYKWMFLAWRVLNWSLSSNDDEWIHSFGDNLFDWLACASPNDDELSIFEMPPADAQRAWLDKILKLAIEAGM